MRILFAIENACKTETMECANVPEYIKLWVFRSFSFPPAAVAQCGEVNR